MTGQMKRYFIAPLFTALLFVTAFCSCAFFRGSREENAPAQAVSDTEAPDGEVLKRVELYAQKLSVQLQPDLDPFAGKAEFRSYAEGRDLVLEYKYLLGMDMRPEAIRRGLDAGGAVYREMFDEFVEFTGDDSCRIILRYLDHEGRRICEYAIDRDYDPGDAASDFDGTKYRTLEAFVDSDYFHALLEASAVEGWRFGASVEKGNRLIVEQTYLADLSPAEEKELTRNWQKSIERDYDDGAASLLISVGAFCEAEDVRVYYRLYDNDGKLLAQYPKR